MINSKALFLGVEVKSLDNVVSSSSISTFKNTWTNLLNHDNLDGWKVGGRLKRRRRNLKWNVKNGVLTPAGEISTSLQSEREFADYDLKFDYRLGRGAKGAVFLRTPPGLAATPKRDLAIQLIDNDSEIPGRRGQTALPKASAKNGGVYGLVAPSVDPGHPVLPDRVQHQLHVREVGLFELNSFAEDGKSLLRQTQGLRIPVQTNQGRLGKAGEKRLGVSPDPDGSVEVPSFPIGYPGTQHFLDEYRLVRP